MKILVTGHHGYIGRVLAPLLVAEGHAVVGLDSDLFAGCDFGGGGGGEEIPTIAKDLRDVTRDDLAGVGAVAHLAGLSNDPLGDIDPALTDEINTRGSVRLARLAREAGVERFLFSSSCSTYGAAGDELLDEEAEFRPVTPYAVSKVEVERALSALADDGFSPTYLRNATAYGVSPRLRLDLVVNNLVAWALTTGEVRLLSDGTPWRPIVHVEDIAGAFLAALRAPRERIHDQAFNVGRSSENYRIREIADLVAEVVPGSRVDVAPGAGPDRRTYRVDFGKLERMLPEFRPRWDLRRGVEELYQAYRAAGLTYQDLDGPTYTRLGQIRRLIDSGSLGPDLRWVGRPAARETAAARG